MAALRSESSEMEKLREEGRGKRQKTEEEEKIKKVTAFFFSFFSSGTKLSFRMKLISLKCFELLSQTSRVDCGICPYFL